MNSFNSLNAIDCAINSCKLCRLHETRHLAVPGEGPGNAFIMFVGEAPGHINDQFGKPFIGHGGRVFDGILTNVGIDRKKIYVTNAVKCWPPENRNPKSDELRICKTYLETQIAIIRPRLIFAFGSVAFMQLTGHKIKIRDNHGKIILVNEIPVCAIFHPNGIRYIKGGKQTIINCIKETIQKLELSPLFEKHNIENREIQQI